MKRSASIILIINTLILWGKVYAQQQCAADYQCGTIPYGYCKGGIDDCPTTLAGVAFDESSNQVYYGVTCRPDPNINYPFTNSTIRRVSADGGAPTTVFTQFNVPAPGNIVKVFTVVDKNLYLNRGLRQPGSAVSAYNLLTGQEKNVDPSPGFFQYYLDIAGGYSFTCQLDFSTGSSYSIYRYPGALSPSTTSGVKLYTVGNSTSNSFCGPVRRGTGSDLIVTRYSYTINQDGSISTFTTTFYKGSISGSTTLPAPLFSVPVQVADFDVNNNGAIIYGTDKGLFRRDPSGATTTLNTETISGVVVYGDKVYFNNGANIRSETIYGGVQQTISQPTAGVCVCRPGFYGSNCESCNGQIQFNFGVPSCVPVNSNGVPASCTQDYQCGNAPFTYCESSSCKCRPNFTGARCDQCAAPRSLSFRNNIPYCE